MSKLMNGTSEDRLKYFVETVELVRERTGYEVTDYEDFKIRITINNLLAPNKSIHDRQLQLKVLIEQLLPKDNN